MEDYEIRQKLSEIKTLLEEKPENPLTLNEAAEYLKVSQANLYRLTSHKLIPFYKPAGKLIYFFRCELDKWVRRNCELRTLPTGRQVMNSELEEKDRKELIVRDPNQIEMELGYIGDGRTETEDRKRNENELVIEFPMKRKKKQTAVGSQKSVNM